MSRRTMGREKAGEVGLRGSAAIGSLKLARDKGGGKACEGKRGGQDMWKGERTPRYPRKMALAREEQMWSWEWKQNSREEDLQKAG